MQLNNKTILLTGASGGIGSAIGRLLINKGARLGLMARNKPALDRLVKELGNNAIAVAGDVGNRESSEKAVKEIISRFKSLDILINNAGVAYYGSIERMDMGSFDKMMKTNVYGVINMIQLTLPYIQKSRGMIVNISSVASKRAIPFLGAYSGSKSMVDAISDALRVELKDRNVKTLNFCPPEVETGFAGNAMKEKGIDFEDNKAVRRMFILKPDRVAKMIVNAMEKEKREVVAIKSIQFVNYAIPGILDNLFYRFIVKKHAKKPGK
ncbi:MAG: SDR family NAD(P)-dependent oxidoreductase [Deltaproteobacteria bacterium]|nr:SDR family NAD(P)-dependent oxidoreductase [Deltaproteobacteria bacterium]MCL5791590.1 SDR family NAD(P)-dependent oxidoreductase [Deltaproteobacteria bacterium]